MTRRLFALLLLVATSSAALAQDTLSKPSSEEQAACIKGFTPLRADAETKAKMIKVASERHAPREEACKLMGDYGAAEAALIKYIEANAIQCGIRASGWLLEQLKVGHKNTERVQQNVCAIAEQARRQLRGPVGDFPDPENGRF
jgi:hypothetical protein